MTLRRPALSGSRTYPLTGRGDPSRRLTRPIGAGRLELPPGPRPRLPFSLEIGLLRDPLSVLTRTAREFGDIAAGMVGRTRVYLVSDPNHIQQVLVTDARAYARGQPPGVITRTLGDGLLTSDGEFHMKQRHAIQPMFHHRQVAGYAQVMVDEATRVARRWRTGDVINIAQETNALALRIAGRTLFGTDVGGSTDRIASALTTVLELFGRELLPFAGLIERLPLRSNRRLHDAERLLDREIRSIIRQRRTTPVEHDDLLSLLMAATDAEGLPMTDQQVRDEVMTLFLAGHETSAGTLAWTWYLLALHPDVQARVHAEVDAVIGDRSARAEDLSALTYIRAVLAESMRLYPPGWFLGRVVATDTRLGDYRLPRGSSVIMSQWVVHRDARWFPDPERFDPDRWLGDRASDLPRYAYFPFGGGSRKCIGESFARLEATLALATLAQRWRLRLVPGQRIAPVPSITLRPPSHGIRMVVEGRHPGAGPRSGSRPFE